MTNTCDTCKWWGVSPYRGIKSGVTELFEPRRWKKCGASGGDGDNDFDIDDYETGSMPSVVTGPKFGCIHWEAKE